jgi:hypothetical protein
MVTKPVQVKISKFLFKRHCGKRMSKVSVTCEEFTSVTAICPVCDHEEKIKVQVHKQTRA